MHIEGLCHGNLSEEEAINISKIFCNTLSAQTLPEEARHRERVICIPNGANFIRSVRVKNDLEENSVVEVGFYSGAIIYYSTVEPFLHAL
jgi:nardilysin